MEANELKIGNYVKDPYGKVIKLVSVESDVSMLRPIPITQAWLIEFGFSVWGGKDKFAQKGNILIEMDESGKGWYLPSYDVIIKYVHQLQNLYFALKKKELNQKSL